MHHKEKAAEPTAAFLFTFDYEKILCLMTALWVFFPVCCRKKKENSRYDRFTVDERDILKQLLNR